MDEENNYYYQHQQYPWSKDTQTEKYDEQSVSARTRLSSLPASSIDQEEEGEVYEENYDESYGENCDWNYILSEIR